MKQKYVLTAVAVVAVGAVALGTVPMWEGTNSMKQEETRTSIIEDPVNTETEGTGTPTPLPTTAPVTGISHTDSYEDLYAQVKEWQNNSSYSNVQPRIMTVEESADAAGTDSAASNSSMAATMPEEPIDQEYGFDPSSEGKDYSTTTAQEELIDEADIVKTDGSCIYAMDSKGTLRIADAASMKLLCEINGENSSDYKEMYVDGNCLQLICQQEDYITYKGSIDLPSANAGGEKNTDGVRTSYSMPVTTVTVETYNISDREKPKKTGVYHQDSGSVTFDGQPVWENVDVKARIASIPDDWFYFMQAGLRDMMRFYRGLYPKFDQERFEKLREVFALDEKRPLRRMSKGQQKQAAFWLALCTMPDYLILDEPVDGLDPVMRRQVWSLILQDVAERGTTVLVSSHNLRELEDVCDHVGVMSRGKLLLEHSLSELQDYTVKLQLAFEGAELPALPQEIKVLHHAQTGRVHTLICRGSAEELEQQLAALHPIFIDAVPLSLEEIFIYELGGEDYAIRDIVL